MPHPTLAINERHTPPDWAVRQRDLITQMNRAAVSFVGKYTRTDGTLIWRDEWPGMDGSDDGYESFLSFPLFYLLGGGEEIHALSRVLWNSVTWQFTQYGQVHREFDAYYDWMHHGESYTYTYYLGLANPDHYVDRTRAIRFADMYTGADPDAPNWDPDLKMIRSPINGSMGPRLEMSAEDWETHRWVLAEYLSPYEDVPGIDGSDPFVKADWNDDEMFSRILELMNDRMVPGDIPMNLNATSLVTHAFMYTGDDRYRQWVLDYLTMWEGKLEQNNGILPDNIGPGGEIGERMDGKWWGGYYGWRWPHGAGKILEATLIAGSNAMLLTGEDRWLDLHRSQLDMLWALRKEEDGVQVVPWKHGDAGWFDYRPPLADFYINLCYISQADQDFTRLHEVCPDYKDWRGGSRFFKGGGYKCNGWFTFASGHNDAYLDETINNTYQGMVDRLHKIDTDDEDVDSWDVHHWQNLNPVVPEALIQLAMGSPGAIYHGGLLHASVRYFDPEQERPGLPDGVSAAVERVDPDAITLTLVSTDPVSPRDVFIQAGAFAEHSFTSVAVLKPESHIDQKLALDGNTLAVSLSPSAQTTLLLGIKRFTNTPTYNFPEFS
jgi:hypothetical protein